MLAVLPSVEIGQIFSHIFIQFVHFGQDSSKVVFYPFQWLKSTNAFCHLVLLMKSSALSIRSQCGLPHSSIEKAFVLWVVNTCYCGKFRQYMHVLPGSKRSPEAFDIHCRVFIAPVLFISMRLSNDKEAIILHCQIFHFTGKKRSFLPPPTITSK